MIRILLLGMLFAAFGALFYLLSIHEDEPKRTLDDWNMQQEFQSKSDDERNPWKRTNRN